MADLFGQLLPEMVGLVITPAAIVACLLLLDSSRPVANVCLFAAAFLAPYLVISGAVLVGGSSSGGGDSAQQGKAWVGVVLGIGFLAAAGAAVVIGLRRRRKGVVPGTPGWVHALEDPSPRTVVAAALALSAINPNLAILVSGLVAIVAAGVSTTDQVIGVVLLLAACLLDFVLPTLAYLLLGRRARAGLHSAKDWLIRNNSLIGVGVLLVFGVLFLARGVSGLA